MNLYIFRHGQTQFNLEDRFQGITNSPLTSTGIEHAKRINDILSHIEINNFYLSPMARVKETFDIATGGLDFNKMVINPLLREICYGQWEAKSMAEVGEIALAERKIQRYTFVHPGEYEAQHGESYAEQFNRITEFMDGYKHEFPNITNTLQTSKANIVIAHNGVLINFYRYFLNLDIEDMHEVRFDNTEFIIWDGTELIKKQF